MRRILLPPPLVLVLAPWLLGADAPSPVSFKKDVAPILVRQCLGCHNAQKAAGGLDMTTFALLKKGGKMGGDTILEPGDPDASQLIELVRPGGAPRMPYKQPPLKEAAVRTLETWVKQGAKFDGPSETETPLAALVDPLKDLPKVALQAPAADPVTSLAYSPDGKTLAAASGLKVLLFDAETGRPTGTLEGHPGPLTAVRFTPDGKALVAAGGRPAQFGSVVVWDLEKKARRFDLKGHGDAILAAEVAPDGKTLATGGYDKQVLLWDLGRGTVVRTLKDHTDAVYAVAFATDGKWLATAGADRTVKVWEAATGRKVRTFSDATAELYAVAFGPDGKTVLAGGVDRSIRAWEISAREEPLANSVFAHDGAILRLVASRDGKTLVSSGEDRDVKVWDLNTLRARSALDDQPDWPQAVALDPTGTRLAVGRYDGSLAVFDLKTGKKLLDPRNAPPQTPAPRPQLVRNASLNPINPRGAVRGATLALTLSGNGVGQATSVIFAEPGLSAAIVPRAKPDPNALDIKLSVAPDARVGVHRVGVVTPLGVPAFQPFAVAAHPEAAGIEPDDDPAAVKPVSLPATLTGVIEKPGDIDHFRFEAKRGQELVFDVLAKPLGSGLTPLVALLDDKGRTLAEAGTTDGSTDPTLTATIPGDGVYTLRVADADYAGSGNHFYRISAGADPYVTAVFPLGVEYTPRPSPGVWLKRFVTAVFSSGFEPGPSRLLAAAGRNLGKSWLWQVRVPADAAPGSILNVPMTRPAGGSWPINRARVVVAEGRQVTEAEYAETATERNDTPSRAEPIATPGGVSGRIGRGGDVDHFTFAAKKGERLIIEVFGRRLGSPIDPALEILDAEGRPVPRAVLRPVAETNVAFRDHNATLPGIRLTQWANLAVNDHVLIGRELARVLALPRNPDDDCQFWAAEGKRLGFLETTPEHHPLGQPVLKVEIHPPGATFPPGGAPPVTLFYRNDDGGPGFGKDARVTFDPPADGAFVARVEDVRGQGGVDYGYHLVVRRPRPDFRLALSTENPNVPRGGAALLTASVTRLDGFEGAVDVTAEGLPPGVTATPARIEPGAFSANLALQAGETAPAFSPPSWTVTARAAAGPSHPALRHDFDPGGPGGGRVTVTPAPNLTVRADPARVEIRPGRRVALTLSVARGPAFAGRVPIEVRNLPQGVRVLNIGLNGVLVTEQQTERSVTLYAEPWAAPTERPFYAVGRAEAAGTEHSSPPIGLVVLPGEDFTTEHTESTEKK